MRFQGQLTALEDGKWLIREDSQAEGCPTSELFYVSCHPSHFPRAEEAWVGDRVEFEFGHGPSRPNPAATNVILLKEMGGSASPRIPRALMQAVIRAVKSNGGIVLSAKLRTLLPEDLCSMLPEIKPVKTIVSESKGKLVCVEHMLVHLPSIRRSSETDLKQHSLLSGNDELVREIKHICSPDIPFGMMRGKLKFQDKHGWFIQEDSQPETCPRISMFFVAIPSTHFLDSKDAKIGDVVLFKHAAHLTPSPNPLATNVVLWSRISSLSSPASMLPPFVSFPTSVSPMLHHPMSMKSPDYSKVSFHLVNATIQAVKRVGGIVASALIPKLLPPDFANALPASKPVKTIVDASNGALMCVKHVVVYVPMLRRAGPNLKKFRALQGNDSLYMEISNALSLPITSESDTNFVPERIDDALMPTRLRGRLVAHEEGDKWILQQVVEESDEGVEGTLFTVAGFSRHFRQAKDAQVGDIVEFEHAAFTPTTSNPSSPNLSFATNVILLKNDQFYGSNTIDSIEMENSGASALFGSSDLLSASISAPSNGFPSSPPQNYATVTSSNGSGTPSLISQAPANSNSGPSGHPKLPPGLSTTQKMTLGGNATSSSAMMSSLFSNPESDAYGNTYIPSLADISGFLSEAPLPPVGSPNANMMSLFSNSDGIVGEMNDGNLSPFGGFNEMLLPSMENAAIGSPTDGGISVFQETENEPDMDEESSLQQRLSNLLDSPLPTKNSELLTAAQRIDHLEAPTGEPLVMPPGILSQTTTTGPFAGNDLWDDTPGCMVLVDMTNVLLAGQNASSRRDGLKTTDSCWVFDLDNLVNLVLSGGNAARSGRRKAFARGVGSATNGIHFTNTKVALFNFAGGEKEVDQYIVRVIAKDLGARAARAKYLPNSAPVERTYCIVSGEKDYLGVVQDALGQNVPVELWTFSQQPSQRYRMLASESPNNLRMFHLEDYMPRFGFRDTTLSPTAMVPDRTMVFQFSRPMEDIRFRQFKNILESTESVYRMHSEGNLYFVAFESVSREEMEQTYRYLERLIESLVPPVPKLSMLRQHNNAHDA